MIKPPFEVYWPSGDFRGRVDREGSMIVVRLASGPVLRHRSQIDAAKEGK